MATPTPQQLADIVQEQQAAEAAALEEETAEQADGGAGAKLAALVAVVLTAWITAFGALTAAGAGAKLVGLLADVRARVDRASAGLGPRSQRTHPAGKWRERNGGKPRRRSRIDADTPGNRS